MSYDPMNDFDEDDHHIEGYTKRVIPVIRVYISYLQENNDMLDLAEVIEALSCNDMSPAENIKSYIEQGMVNIYACSFNQVKKVI
jgi:hypothetical protein